jgi:hypothetical protein
MNPRKIESRQNRLNQVQAKIEARKNVLAARGLDAKLIEKDSTMRHLLAEARKVKRSIKALQREPAEKQSGKPPKEAAQPKAKKPPKEKKPPKDKKPKQEEEAPTG